MRTAALLLALLLGAPASAEHDVATTRVFHTDIASHHMTVYTPSPGTGHGEFILDLPTLTLSYEVTFDNLTSAPTSVFLHGPAHPGTNAPRMINLVTSGKVASPVKGKVKITESQVQYMLQSWTYVMIGTEKNPNGEIRGKFEVIPPTAWKVIH